MAQEDSLGNEGSDVGQVKMLDSADDALHISGERHGKPDVGSKKIFRHVFHQPGCSKGEGVKDIGNSRFMVGGSDGRGQSMLRCVCLSRPFLLFLSEFE